MINNFDFSSLYPTTMKVYKINNKTLIRKIKYLKLFTEQELKNLKL